MHPRFPVVHLADACLNPNWLNCKYDSNPHAVLTSLRMLTRSCASSRFRLAEVFLVSHQTDLEVFMNQFGQR